LETALYLHISKKSCYEKETAHKTIHFDPFCSGCIGGFQPIRKGNIKTSTLFEMLHQKGAKLHARTKEQQYGLYFL
jgi:hypothetical protein